MMKALEKQMYSLLRNIPRRALLIEQAPAMGGSLLVAEVFFKFGSFTLEAIAFLATWFVLDAAIQALTRLSQGTLADKRNP